MVRVVACVGTATAVIIDRKMLSVAITCFAGYLLSCFGFIHSASLGFYPLSVFGKGYLIIAILALIFHYRKKWIIPQDDFEYV